MNNETMNNEARTAYCVLRNAYCVICVMRKV